MPIVSLSDIIARIERAATAGRVCLILVPCVVERISQIDRLAAAGCLGREVANRLALEAEALAFAFPPLPEEA